MMLLIIIPAFNVTYSGLAPKVGNFEQMRQNTWIYKFRLILPAYHAEIYLYRKALILVTVAEETHSRYY
jgi:hypothetical protein